MSKCAASFSGEQNLGLDGGLAHGLHRARMQAQIDAVLGVNLVERDGQQKIVDVVAAQMRVAVGGLHLEDAVAQFENRNIKGPAAQIVDGNGALFGAVEAVGQRGRGRLVDQTQHFEAGHAPRVLGGLALRIVEVGGHGDDRLRDRRAKESLGVALELAQNVGGNLRRREAQLAQLNARDFTCLHILGQVKGKELQLVLNLFKAAAHQPLDGVDDPLRRLDQRLARAVAHGDRGPAAACAEWDRAPPPTAPDSSRPRRESPPAHRPPCMRPGSWWFPDRFRLRVTSAMSSSGSQNFGYVADQIAEVAPPVEQGHHLFLRGLARCAYVALIPCAATRRADRRPPLPAVPSNFLFACSSALQARRPRRPTRAPRASLRAACSTRRPLRADRRATRRIFSVFAAVLFANLRALELEQIFGAAERILEGAIGVVEQRRIGQAPLLLVLQRRGQSGRDAACGSGDETHAPARADRDSAWVPCRRRKNNRRPAEAESCCNADKKAWSRCGRWSRTNRQREPRNRELST